MEEAPRQWRTVVCHANNECRMLHADYRYCGICELRVRSMAE